MWDDAAKKLAIKVIGTVESNMKYDSIYYVDPITVGIMQWYGTRAANILNEMRATPAWNGVVASLHDDLVSVPETNSSFWTSRYLLKSEGESLKPVLRSVTGKNIQHAKTLSDLEEYKYQATRVFIDPETETQQFIFFCVMYHQSPKYAREIINNAGANPSLARLHSMALNHSWFKKFKSRYDQAKAMILSGDTSGIPDFGTDAPPSPDPDPDDDNEGDITPPVTDGTTQTLGDVGRIDLVGGALHVHTSKGVVIAQPTNTGASWVVGTTNQPTAGPVIAPPTPVPDPIAPPTDPVTPPTAPPTPGSNAATKAAVVAFLVTHQKKFRYSQGGGRDKPLQSGVTDCSAVVAWAYREVANIDVDGGQGGTGGNTVSQYNKGKGIWSNLPGNGVRTPGSGQPPDSVMEAGDLVYFSRDSSFSRVRHVEMYMGDGRFIGWGGNTRSYPYPGKGPYIKPNSQSYMNYYKWITVRRHL